MKNFILLVIISLTVSYNTLSAQQGLPPSTQHNNKAEKNKYEQIKEERIKNNPEKSSDEKEVSKEEANRLKYPITQEDNTLHNPYKDLQIANDNIKSPAKNDSFLFFTDDSTSIDANKYLKEFTTKENIEKEIEIITPKNGTSWLFEKAVATSTNSDIKESDIQFAQQEMNNDLINEGFMIIMNESEFLSNHSDTKILFDYEIKNKKLTITPKKECAKCKPRIFEIEEQTSTSLILNMLYDDNENIVIHLHFKQVQQP